MFGKKQKLSPVSTPIQNSPIEPEEKNDVVPYQAPPPSQYGQTITNQSEAYSMLNSDLTASVSKNTVFTGNIVSEDNIEIFGTVEGCINGAALVKIHGKVHGDVSCGVLVAGNATVTGNICCESSASFGENTNVTGNICATIISVSGQINGNIIASTSVSVSSKGAIYGDIRTPEMEVSKGAIVFGSVVMEQPPAEKPEEPESPKAVEPEPEPLPETTEEIVTESAAVTEERDEDAFSPWKSEKKRGVKSDPLALKS